MITKIKRFALPCILTALWICVLLEVCKFLAPVGCFLGLVENYHYQVIRLNNALIDSTFLYGLIEVFSLLFYIALTLSVPFVFSAIYKRYNGSDDSCEKYLLTTVFVLIFCRLSWTNCVGGLYPNSHSFYSESPFDSSFLKGLIASLVDDVFSVIVIFFILIGLAAAVSAIFKLACKKDDTSKKATIAKYVVSVIIFFAFAYVAMPYLCYYGSNSFIARGVSYDFLSYFTFSSFIMQFTYSTDSLVPLLSAIYTCPPVILSLITLAFYYLISKKEEESFAKTIVKKISASALSSTIVLFIYCLLFNVCFCIYDAFFTYIIYNWLSPIVLLISSPFVPLTFLTAFDASNKEKPRKILKYTIYVIITLVYYGAIISEFFVDYSSFLAVVSCIIPFIVLAVCAITEAKGKPLTAKLYSLFKKALDNRKNDDQGVKVKPDSFKQLKQRAKKQLGGNIFASAWLMLLFSLIIQGTITGWASITLIGGILVSGPMLMA